MNNNYKKILSLFSFVICFLFLPIGVSAISVAVHVPEKYNSVSPGERLYFEVAVKYPENPRRKDLRLNYEIYDNEQNVIAQAKFLKAIETQASFMDYIIIPASAKKKTYNIRVKITDYESLSEEVATSFEVVRGEMSELKIYLLSMLLLILIFGVTIVTFLIYLLKKEKTE